jgi:carbonic anhydrase/acetyltransferase-like protein (isoleucine patch superfamily)
VNADLANGHAPDYSNGPTKSKNGPATPNVSGIAAIGARVTVGARGAILYDTHMGDDARLGPLTLVAKGERLPGGTRWEGSPAKPAREP